MKTPVEAPVEPAKAQEQADPSELDLEKKKKLLLLKKKKLDELKKKKESN